MDKRFSKMLYPYLRGAEKEFPVVSFLKKITKRKEVGA